MINSQLLPNSRGKEENYILNLQTVATWSSSWWQEFPELQILCLKTAAEASKCHPVPGAHCNDLSQTIIVTPLQAVLRLHWLVIIEHLLVAPYYIIFLGHKINIRHGLYHEGTHNLVRKQLETNVCRDSVRDQAVRPDKGEVQNSQRRINVDENSGDGKDGEIAHS